MLLLGCFFLCSIRDCDKPEESSAFNIFIIGKENIFKDLVSVSKVASDYQFSSKYGYENIKCFLPNVTNEMSDG